MLYSVSHNLHSPTKCVNYLCGFTYENHTKICKMRSGRIYIYWFPLTFFIIMTKNASRISPCHVIVILDLTLPLCMYIHTGWCILSRTTAIPHMVHQGDAPVYYLRVILLIWNILTRTIEVMSMNKRGKMCDVMWMASRIVKKTIIVCEKFS